MTTNLVGSGMGRIEVVKSSVVCCCFFTAVLSSTLNAQEFRVIPSPPKALPAPVQVDLATPSGVDVFTFQSGPNMTASYAMPVWYASGPNSDLIDLLSSQQIQKQIEFSDDQKKEFNDFRKQLSEEYKKISSQFPELKDKNLPPKERQKINQSVTLKYMEVKKELSKELEENLVPQQLKLVQQVMFRRTVQMFGFSRALSQGKFGEEISLSESQKKELEKIRKETEEAIQKKIAEMRQDAKDKMLKALDKKQRDKIKELEGDSKGKANAHQRL